MKVLVETMTHHTVKICGLVCFLKSPAIIQRSQTSYTLHTMLKVQGHLLYFLSTQESPLEMQDFQAKCLQWDYSDGKGLQDETLPYEFNGIVVKISDLRTLASPMLPALSIGAFLVMNTDDPFKK